MAILARVSHQIWPRQTGTSNCRWEGLLIVVDQFAKIKVVPTASFLGRVKVTHIALVLKVDGVSSGKLEGLVKNSWFCYSR
jgi:hypothetical protein